MLQGLEISRPFRFALLKYLYEAYANNEEAARISHEVHSFVGRMTFAEVPDNVCLITSMPKNMFINHMYKDKDGFNFSGLPGLEHAFSDDSSESHSKLYVYSPKFSYVSERQLKAWKTLTKCQKVFLVYPTRNEIISRNYEDYARRILQYMSNDAHANLNDFDGRVQMRAKRISGFTLLLKSTYGCVRKLILSSEPEVSHLTFGLVYSETNVSSIRVAMRNHSLSLCFDVYHPDKNIESLKNPIKFPAELYGRDDAEFTTESPSDEAPILKQVEHYEYSTVMQVNINLLIREINGICPPFVVMMGDREFSAADLMDKSIRESSLATLDFNALIVMTYKLFFGINDREASHTPELWRASSQCLVSTAFKNNSEKEYLYIQGPNKTKYSVHQVVFATFHGKQKVANTLRSKFGAEDISHLCHRRQCLSPYHLVNEERSINNKRRACALSGVCRGHRGLDGTERRKCILDAMNESPHQRDMVNHTEASADETMDVDREDSSLNDSINELFENSDYDSIEQDVATLFERNGSLRKAIAKLMAKRVKLQAQMLEIQEKRDKCKAEIDKFKHKISKLNGQIDSLDALIEAAQKTKR
jgi:hypothetical protein